jgi:SAM-dependent methyltransferase
MDELAKEYVISFFERSLLLHGDRPEAVRWTAPGQRAHYAAMLDIGDLSDAKVLDYGCGTGGLYGFLRDAGLSVDYTGYDINTKLIEAASAKYPDGRFAVFDIEEQELTETFDYILLCGVFNLKVQDVEQTIPAVLRKLFAHCRVGLAFNALSDQSPRKDYELSYTSPAGLFLFAVSELSPYVSIRHDRLLYDYCMFVYRNSNPHPLTREVNPAS